MRASIVIATRNRAKQLRLALSSIAARNYAGVEIVVVDDGSTDDTGEVIRGASEWLPLKSIRLSRGGGYRRNPSRALNVGHQAANGDIIIEQGGEVCHLTDCVMPLLKICRPGVVALARVYCGTSEEMQLVKQDLDAGEHELPPDYWPDKCETRGEKMRGPRIGERHILLYCGAGRPAPFLFCGAIHQVDFRAAGGQNETLSDRNDEDLANRLQARGVKFCFVGKAVAFHLRHGKS